MSISETPVISVVIAVRDAEATLRQQLASVVEQSSRFAGQVEIVIVDDYSSTPQLTSADLRPYSGAIRVIRLSEQRGPGGARNAGAAVAKGQIFAFLDADDVADGQYLSEVWEAMTAGGLDALIGHCTAAGLNPTWLAAARPDDPADWDGTYFGWLPAGGAAALSVRASAFADVGGFDEEPKTGEDIDICWRLQAAGHRFGRSSQAVVQYRLRSNYPDLFRQGLAYGRDTVWLWRKHQNSGMTRATAQQVVRGWRTALGLLLSFGIDARSSRARGSFLLGIRVGRLWGTVRWRSWYP